MKNQRTLIKSIPCKKNPYGITRGRVIYLRREGSMDKGGDFFKINGVIGEGGSCVCYDATLLGEGKTGRLKEFYPIQSSQKNASFVLERDERNNVVATNATKEEFISARTEFVESYHLLRKVMEKKKNNSDFTSFIPDFSIYYCCDAEGNIIEGSTAYIWTAPENLMVFDKYIADVHKYPNIDPERKLYNILKATATLAECIKILHENALLHLDIKPGNFGIPKRKGKLLTESITLFDVNTIDSYQSSFTSGYGTEGFRAPEIANGEADNTSDIYSIGCTLFAALITNDENEALTYSKQYYTKINELIDSSKIIVASETNSNIYLKDKLVLILKKCLAESQRKRYQSCVDLIKDLEGALVYLYPAQINAKLPINQQIVVLDKELDKKQGAGDYLTLMYHLYKKPLFEYLSDDSEILDILIIGFGNRGQRFLDCCLQVGQIYGKKLRVQVVSNDRVDGKRDKDVYLASRPALADFFSIDGSLCEDPYGYISFENREFVRGKLKANKEIALDIISEHEKCHYVFVALGNDSLNKGVAKAISEVMVSTDNCSINFAYDGEHMKRKPLGNPVYMSDNIKTEALFKDIERMAFNAHLVWESGLNIDFAKSRAKFMEPYNYNASFANVVAIKYKLYSIGITLDNLNEAAIQSYEKITSSTSSIKNELIALEHRRWVCEKICAGWVCNHDLKSCLAGKTNDKKYKRHICILRSTAATPLQTEKWTLAKWDKANDKQLATLDDLDRMSVELHQVYKKEADRIKKESTLLDSNVIQLRNIARKCDVVSIAFSEWYSCMSLLWNGNDNPAREYQKLKKALIDSLVALNDKDKKYCKDLIEMIGSRFEVILNSMRYPDYKNYDADLVNYIPFILTYKKDTHLLIPFSCGNNTEMFANVAALTVVNPSLVTYLFHVSKVCEIESFKDALAYILNYMREKTISTKINFVITHCKNEKIRSAVETMKAELLENSKIQKVDIVEQENDEDIAQSIFDTFDGKIRFDAIEQNETPLSYLLLGAGFYSKYPHYQFDINTRKFYKTVDCEFLKFIKAEQYLTISNMFASKNSKGYLESPAAFYNDYEQLWHKVYRHNEFIWKKMCGLLEAYHENEDKIVTIKTDAITTNPTEIKHYKFLIPSIAYEGAKKLISAMVEANIFGGESEVHFYTIDSCEINIYASKLIEDDLKALMSNPYILSQPDNIEIVKTPSSVVVSFDYLTVSVKKDDLEKLVGKHIEKHIDRIKNMLKSLEEDFSFIIGYTECDDKVSFTYATKRIKKLLTNAGNILEIYIYHKCLKSDLFDDVATSYEISWDGTPVKSEFDIIITKGFAGLLVEAKARENIDQNYYFKLSCLAEQFGTNCRSVLVADTVEKPYKDNSNNEMQRQRGGMLDVITISDSKQIDNIDITLAQLLNIPTKTTVKVQSQPQPQPQSQAYSQSKATPEAQEKKQNAPKPEKESSISSGKMTREEFLAQGIKVLGLDQKKESILLNNKIRTIGDFLKQTAGSFSLMKGKNIGTVIGEFLSLHKKMKQELDKL